jgi:hypothetical protein
MPSHLLCRHFTARTLLLVVLGAAVAAPVVADAKPLCISNSANAYHLVLPKPKLKKGKPAVLLGYFIDGTVIWPAHGSAVVKADGTGFAFAAERGQAYTGGASGEFSAPPDQLNFLFVQPDGHLDVGDIGGGYYEGAGATFTVVDCASEPVYP